MTPFFQLVLSAGRGAKRSVRQRNPLPLFYGRSLASSAASNAAVDDAVMSRSKAQAYLDGWVGLPPRTNANSNSNATLTTNNSHHYNPVMRARAAMAKGPLLLSSHSYLLPTLRLERNETPESLDTRLEQASPGSFHDNNNNNNNNNNKTKTAGSSWCCPIILDVSALAPDGSPHYRPPPPGTLMDMIAILRKYQMQVTGVTSFSSLSLSLTEEVTLAGIPSLWSPRSNGSLNDNSLPKFDVSQVLQLVRQKQQEEQNQNENSISEAINNTTKLCDNADAKPTSKHQATTKEISRQKSEELKDATVNVKPIADSLQESTSQNKTELDENPNPVVAIEFSSSSTLYHGSVRSGQQVMSSKGQSLVILGSVNSGGEVLSDGDIFVFGKLRGRAFAGLGGTDSDNSIVQLGEIDISASVGTSPARIVATSFDAELVAIGDVFTTIDRVEDVETEEGAQLQAGQPIMVTLERSHINASAVASDGSPASSRRYLKFLPVNF